MILEEILTNRIVISVLFAIAVSQVAKMVLTLVKKKTLDITLLWDTGGMPSSHAALASALALGALLEEGITTVSIVTTFLCIVIIRDAFGHRKETGLQARALNMIIKDLSLSHKLNIKRLKELVGHNFNQVVAGIIVGVLCTCIAFQVNLGAGYPVINFWIVTGLATIYFAMPGFVANMMPIMVKRHFKSLDIPVDCGLKFRGKRVFGDHKTVRGYVFGILGGFATGFFQYLLRDNTAIQQIAYVDYTLGTSLAIGGVFAFAALFGDSIESFFKRAFSIDPGKPFIPFDQIDYLLGIIAASFFFKAMTLPMIIFLLVLGPFATVLTTRLGYALKLRKVKW